MEFSISEDDKRIILALSTSRNYRKNNIEMIKEIQRTDNLYTVIICVNHPQSFLTDYYGKNGIDTGRIFFIDAITQYATGSNPKDTDNCFFISRPGDLTALSVAITKIMKRFRDERTIILLDSVNAMLIHTDSASLTKFIHFLISKLRVMNIAGILLAVEKGLDPMLMDQIMLFADEMFEFPGDEIQ